MLYNVSVYMDLCTCNVIGIVYILWKLSLWWKNSLKIRLQNIYKPGIPWYWPLLQWVDLPVSFNIQTKEPLEDEQLMWEALKQIHERLGRPGSSASRNRSCQEIHDYSTLMSSQWLTNGGLLLWCGRNQLWKTRRLNESGSCTTVTI